ncbi:ATP-binding cassette domain-containing protein [bacterium]|nr:ATP-binding cassette domain-containing protein [bacterium]
MIELNKVSKNYDTVKALQDVSFKIEPNEIVGFLGPNGAGKTTALKIITTYLAQTSGKVTVGGYDVLENPLKVRELIGYLPEHPVLYLDMPTLDYLKFVGKARNIKGAQLKKRVDWVIEKCGLQKVVYKKIHQLSKGFQQRVGLAQALIHDPQILILDEPTSGLDPIQIIGIRDLIKEMSKEKTIIFSTHILSEITHICDRVIVIHEGQIKADGKVDKLISTVPSANEIYLTLKENASDVEKSIQAIKGVNLCKVEKSDSDCVTYKIGGDSDVCLEDEVNAIVLEKKWKLKYLYGNKASLEDVFIYLTQKDSQGGDK